MEEGIYSYFLEEEGDEITYNFSNKHASYAVYFSSSQYIDYMTSYPTLLHNSYGMGIACYPIIVGDKCPQDNKIKNTIESIICDFLAEKGDSTILLYHCDFSDDKQHLRSRKFDFWYSSSDCRDNLIKNEIVIATTQSNTNQYVGYLSQRDNPNIEIAQKEFEQFAVNITEEDK